MKDEKHILDQIGHRDGMTVPEGYFADFAARMTASLPVTEYEQSASAVRHRPTLWHRIRPYAYMAAMFAGVWCMLKMFTMLTATSDQYPQPSAVLAEALNNDAFMSEYVLDDLNQWDLVDEMMDDGFEVCSIDTESDSAIVAEDEDAPIRAEADKDMQKI